MINIYLNIHRINPDNQHHLVTTRIVEAEKLDDVVITEPHTSAFAFIYIEEKDTTINYEWVNGRWEQKMEPVK